MLRNVHLIVLECPTVEFSRKQNRQYTDVFDDVVNKRRGHIRNQCNKQIKSNLGVSWGTKIAKRPGSQLTLPRQALVRRNFKDRPE